MVAKNKRMKRKSPQLGIPTHKTSLKKNKTKSKIINCKDCTYYVHPKFCSKNNVDLSITGIMMAKRCKSFNVKRTSKWKLKHQSKSTSTSTGKHGKVTVRKLTEEEMKKY